MKKKKIDIKQARKEISKYQHKIAKKIIRHLKRNPLTIKK